MAKKRVRYLAAAAALGPAAVGVLATPTAAHASTGCTGHTPFTLPTDNINGHPLVRGHGWYTQEPNNKLCIGTVVVSVYTSQTGIDVPELTIAGGITVNRHSSRSGTAGHWVNATFGVHDSGHYRVVVSGWSKYFTHTGTQCIFNSGSLSCRTYNSG
jgi:hypothetical protein